MTSNSAALMCSPRDLSKSELSELRGLLQINLNMDACNDEDKEDADILLEYACDMVIEGQNIKHIVRELASMEMSICDRVVATRMGNCLLKYYRDIMSSKQRKNMLQIQMKSPHMSTNIKTTTASNKKEDTTQHLQVLSVNRNGKEESITTFLIKQRMPAFENKPIKMKDQPTTVRRRSSSKENMTGLEKQLSESSIEGRRASYRQTTNKDKMLRKQKREQAKLYNRSSRTMGNDLKHRLADYQETASSFPRAA